MAKDIESPFLWFSQPVNAQPKPWTHFKIDGLIVNAYEILQKNSANKNVKEKGIHQYLEFKGPVTMDSGGFFFMMKKVLNVHPQEILELYELSKPDFGVVLDHPLEPNLSYYQRKKRLLKSLENTKYMLHAERNKNPELIPVVHGYSKRTIAWYIKALHKIGEFETYGIGSLVPSVFNSKGAGGINNVVKIVSYIRKLLPEKKIHVFGIGSTITMHLMFYTGANSIDSSSWRTKAAFGAIQLSGIGDRYITSKKRNRKYRDLSKTEGKILDQCKCPVCKKEGLEKLKTSFKARALHNSWVFQKEVETARKLTKNGEYEEYVQDILSKSSYSGAFDLANELRI
jgi:tRNA-guanine family transglycosylase